MTFTLMKINGVRVSTFSHGVNGVVIAYTIEHTLTMHRTIRPQECNCVDRHDWPCPLSLARGWTHGHTLYLSAIKVSNVAMHDSAQRNSSLDEHQRTN